MYHFKKVRNKKSEINNLTRVETNISTLWDQGSEKSEMGDFPGWLQYFSREGGVGVSHFLGPTVPKSGSSRAEGARFTKNRHILKKLLEIRSIYCSEIRPFNGVINKWKSGPFLLSTPKPQFFEFFGYALDILAFFREGVGLPHFGWGWGVYHFWSI